MGFVICTGVCANCNAFFSFNPMRVPSVRVNGVREPICRNCIERVNPVRIASGLEPIRILDGAYDACPEDALSFD